MVLNRGIVGGLVPTKPRLMSNVIPGHLRAVIRPELSRARILLVRPLDARFRGSPGDAKLEPGRGIHY